MRIGIDIQSTTGKPSGLGYYTRNLLRHIKEIDSENEYILLCSNFFRGNLSTPKRIFWEQIALPVKIYREKLDLLHIPAFCPPIIRNCKLIVTLHDLIGIRFPENNLSPISRFYWGKYLPQIAKMADMIITDSECSKKDIIELLKLPEGKVKVIYLAAGKEFKPINDEEKLKNVRIKYRIGDYPYVLYVGNIEPRKNLIHLVNVWSNLLLPHKLIIVGAETKFSKVLINVIKEKNLGSKVILTGYVTINDLVLLYNGASLFVYPSLYEGFGLPVLEAMSCGIPVVVSNIPSLQEVVGEAALTVDSTDVEALMETIKKVLTDAILWRRLSEKVLIQAKKFSWEKTAKETLQVYKTMH